MHHNKNIFTHHYEKYNKTVMTKIKILMKMMNNK